MVFVVSARFLRHHITHHKTYIQPTSAATLGPFARTTNHDPDRPRFTTDKLRSKDLLLVLPHLRLAPTCKLSPSLCGRVRCAFEERHQDWLLKRGGWRRWPLDRCETRITAICNLRTPSQAPVDWACETDGETQEPGSGDTQAHNTTSTGSGGELSSPIWTPLCKPVWLSTAPFVELLFSFALAQQGQRSATRTRSEAGIILSSPSVLP